MPLRPILSVVGSSHHKLAKWLASILQPVLEQFSTNCIKDSIAFAQTMQDLRLKGKKVFLCSFDISSLYTNVPLKETIGICAEALYKEPSSTPPIPQAVFIELMESATSSVEFRRTLFPKFTLSCIPFYSQIIGGRNPPILPGFRPHCLAIIISITL